MAFLLSDLRLDRTSSARQHAPKCGAIKQMRILTLPLPTRGEPAGTICCRAGRYAKRVIKSFADAETAGVWNGRRSRRLPLVIQPTALRKLRMLNQARVLTDRRVPPGNRLEALRGDRRGQYSIRINQQWRIRFRWHQGAAYDVEIVDYHD